MELACRILCTTSTLFGSRFMSWGLEEPGVHIALHFPHANLVYHSTFTGVDTVHEKSFFKLNDVMALHELKVEDRSKFFDIITDVINPSPYDFGAWFYFAFRAGMRKFWGIPLPETNKWQHAEGILCTEMLAKVDNAYYRCEKKRILPQDVDLTMNTPWELIHLVQKTDTVDKKKGGKSEATA